MANIWVVNQGEQWAVRREGSDAIVSSHRTQEEAAASGRTLAQQEKSELIVQGRDGQIQYRNSYGNESSARG